MRLAKRCRTENAQVQLTLGFSCGTLFGEVGIAHVPSPLSNPSWLENAANPGRAKQLDPGPCPMREPDTVTLVGPGRSRAAARATGCPPDPMPGDPAVQQFEEVDLGDPLEASAGGQAALPLAVLGARAQDPADDLSPSATRSTTCMRTSGEGRAERRYPRPGRARKPRCVKSSRTSSGRSSSLCQPAGGRPPCPALSSLLLTAPHTARGAYMMTATATGQITVPRMSHRSGRKPSSATPTAANRPRTPGHRRRGCVQSAHPAVTSR